MKWKICAKNCQAIYLKLNKQTPRKLSHIQTKSAFSFHIKNLFEHSHHKSR